MTYILTPSPHRFLKISSTLFSGRHLSMDKVQWSRHPYKSLLPLTPTHLCSPKSVAMTSTSQLLGLAEVGLRCDQEIERRYEIVPSVVCSMCCLFGIIYCFFGKKLLFLDVLLQYTVLLKSLCHISFPLVYLSHLSDSDHETHFNIKDKHIKLNNI